MRSSIQSIRNAFIAGLLLLAPLGVCVFVINFLLKNIGGPASQLIFSSLKIEMTPMSETLLSAAAILLVCVGVTIFGFLSNYFLGKFIVKFTEVIFQRVPFLNSIYKTVKQIIDTFATQKTAVFQKVVLLEFPRKGCRVIGFLTGEGQGELEAKAEQKLYNIFVPTTPNPTSGFLIMLPPEEFTILEMTIAEGMKFIISGGAVVPTKSEKTDNPPQNISREENEVTPPSAS